MQAAGAPVIHVIAAPQDMSRVVPIIRRLIGRGFAVHTEPTRPPAWPLLTLVAVSAVSNRWPAVRQAAEAALAAGARVAPLLLVPRSQLPAYLANLQWVDYSAKPRSGKTEKGALEGGWLDLLAALDRAGATDNLHDPGWFDWELALARAYRGLLPPGWRAYRSSATYYWRRASDGLILVLAGIPALLCGLGVNVMGSWLPLFHIIPGQILPDPVITTMVTICATGALAIVTARPVLVASRNALLRDDRSEVIVFSRNGFVLRTHDRMVVRAFRDLTGVGQVSDVRRSIFSDLEPERGLRLVRGQVAGTLRLRQRGGTEETVALGDRFPERETIVRQVVETFAVGGDVGGDVGGGPGGGGDLSHVTPIFISHARADRVAVDRIDEVVRLAGYQTWVDRGMLAAGEDWARELDRAIAVCAALLVVVTPASMASGYVAKEYERALELGKPVLAVTLRPARKIADVVRSRRCADVTAGLGARSWRRGWAPLLVALERAGARTAPAAAFNARMAVAHALTGAMPEGSQAFEAAPFWREIRNYRWTIFLALPLIGLLASLTLHANMWILAAWASLALVLGWQGWGVFWRTLGNLRLLVITPLGAVLLRGEDIDEYLWADYDSIRDAPFGEPGPAWMGGLILKQRGVNRERRISFLEDFKPVEPVANALRAAFLASRISQTNRKRG